MADDLAARVSELLGYAVERGHAGDTAEVQRAADILLSIDAEALALGDPAITRNLLDAATAVLNAGDFQRGEALMHKGITALSSNPGASKVDLIVPFHNLIALYDQVQAHERASALAGTLGAIVEELDEPLTAKAATVLMRMGKMYEDSGRLAPALVMYRPVHVFMMADPNLASDTVVVWAGKYMQTLLAAGRFDEVRSVGYQVLESAPDNTRIEFLAIIAEAANRAGDAVANEEALDRAVVLAERLEDSAALTSRGQIAAGAVYHNLAVHYLGQHRRDNYPRGQALLRREIAILLATGRGGSAEHAGAVGQLAVLTEVSGDLENAERLYIESIDTYDGAADTPAAEFADYLTDLGMLRLRRGRAAEAVAPFQRALQLRDASADRQADATSNLATAFFDAGDLSAASSQYNRAIDLRFAAVG